MTDFLIILIAAGAVLGTLGLLIMCAWDFRDDFKSMHARLDRRDARRAERAQRRRHPN